MTAFKQKIVAIDFDNTFYTPKRDVDDGLALLYLLGTGEVELVSVTTTYGNCDIETVNRDTERLLAAVGLEPELMAGGGGECGAYLSPASRQLANLADRYAGRLSILVTGSLTNLHGAYLINPAFFDQVQEICLMGGTTAPLRFQKQVMEELNFSLDPQASYSVLKRAKKLSILTGNHCLELLFTRREYEECFTRKDSPVVALIQKYSDPWFRDNERDYGIKGFYNWDTLAAAYLLHPEYYKDSPQSLWLGVEGLARGRLNVPPVDASDYVKQRPYTKRTINLPRVKLPADLRRHLYQCWQQVD